MSSPVTVAALRMVEDRFGDGDAAGRAHAKLERLLPPGPAARVAATHLVTEVLPDRSPAIDLGTVGTLAEAAAADGRVSFTYERRDGNRSSRLVDPYRQVVHRGRWRCWVGTSDATTGGCTAATGSVILERVTGTYARRELPAESAAAYLSSSFAEPPIEVTVVFDAEVADVERRLTRPDGELTDAGSGRARYTTRVGDLDWFAANLAVLGMRFGVEHPAELRTRCAALARVLAGAGT